MLRVPLSLTFLVVVSTMALESHAGEAEDAAHVHAKAGAAAFNLGHYTEAVAEYEAAYRAVPDPVFLYDVGQAHRLSGNNEKAIIAYKSYLRTAPRDAPNRAQVEKHIAELEAGSPDKDANPRSVVRPEKLTPDLRARSARLTIERSTAEPALSPTIETARSLQASAPPDQGWWLGRKWTWVAAGTAVAFTGTAAVFGLAMRSKFDNLNKSCGSASNSTVACSSNQIDSAITLKNTANIFWSLAGAAAVTTGVVFFIEGRPTTVTPMAGQATGFLASMRY